MIGLRTMLWLVAAALLAASGCVPAVASPPAGPEFGEARASLGRVEFLRRNLLGDRFEVTLNRADLDRLRIEVEQVLANGMSTSEAIVLAASRAPPGAPRVVISRWTLALCGDLRFEVTRESLGPGFQEERLDLRGSRRVLEALWRAAVRALNSGRPVAVTGLSCLPGQAGLVIMPPIE